jgi:hypothetical protein
LNKPEENKNCVLHSRIFRRMQGTTMRNFVRWIVALSVCLSIWLSVFLSVCPQSSKHVLKCYFSAICRWFDLKFGRDLQVNLLFVFLLIFLLSFSYNSSFYSFSSEFEFCSIYNAKDIGRKRCRQQVTWRKAESCKITQSCAKSFGVTRSHAKLCRIT